MAGTPPDQPLGDGNDVDFASPFKRQRASVEGLDAAITLSPETAQSSTSAAMLHAIKPTASPDEVAKPASTVTPPSETKAQDEDEEL